MHRAVTSPFRGRGTAYTIGVTVTLRNKIGRVGANSNEIIAEQSPGFPPTCQELASTGTLPDLHQKKRLSSPSPDAKNTKLAGSGIGAWAKTAVPCKKNVE